jgi:hypothetical protein
LTCRGAILATGSLEVVSLPENPCGNPAEMPMSTAEGQQHLDENALADWMVRLLDAIRPHFFAIAASVVALVGASIAWLVISSTNAATEARSWESYLAALSSGDTTAFNDVARRYPGSKAAMWSQLVLADMALTDGAVLAFQDRDTSRGRLESAVDLYASVLEAGPQGLLAERATFGMAKAQESLGEFDAARDGYAAVAERFAESPLASVAQQHADALAGQATRGWYDWFFAQDLRPATPANDAATETTSSDGASAGATDSLFDEEPSAADGKSGGVAPSDTAPNETAPGSSEPGRE